MCPSSLCRLQAGAAGAIELKARNKSSRGEVKKGGNKVVAANRMGGSGGKGKKGGDAGRLERQLSIDPNSDKTIQEQLTEGLAKNSARVMDLFREWDDDGNGEVSKKEFRKAMKMLGISPSPSPNPNPRPLTLNP